MRACSGPEQTLVGTPRSACPKHGCADVGVLTGTCLVCEREIDARLYERFVDSLVTWSKRRRG